MGHHIRRNRKLFLHKRFAASFSRLRSSADETVEDQQSYRPDWEIRLRHQVCVSYCASGSTGWADSWKAWYGLFRQCSFHQGSAQGAFKTSEELEAWYREVHLNALYHTSTLRHSPDMAQLKEVMMACTWKWYGSLEKSLQGAESDVFRKLEEIKRIVNSWVSWITHTITLRKMKSKFPLDKNTFGSEPAAIILAEILSEHANTKLLANVSSYLSSLNATLRQVQYIPDARAEWRVQSYVQCSQGTFQ